MQWFPPHNHIYFQCNTVLCINFITLKLLSFFFFFLRLHSNQTRLMLCKKHKFKFAVFLLLYFWGFAHIKVTIFFQIVHMQKCKMFAELEGLVRMFWQTLIRASILSISNCSSAWLATSKCGKILESLYAQLLFTSKTTNCHSTYLPLKKKVSICSREKESELLL